MVKYVKFNDIEYSTSDSEADPDYQPILECESCADSYEVIEEQNEKLFVAEKTIKNLQAEVSKLRQVILNIGKEIQGIILK